MVETCWRRWKKGEFGGVGGEQWAKAARRPGYERPFRHSALFFSHTPIHFSSSRMIQEMGLLWISSFMSLNFWLECSPYGMFTREIYYLLEIRFWNTVIHITSSFLSEMLLLPKGAIGCRLLAPLRPYKGNLRKGNDRGLLFFSFYLKLSGRLMVKKKK